MTRKPERSRAGYSVGKPTYTTKRGATKTAAKWYANFRDSEGRWRRLPAFCDHDASLELAKKIRRLGDLRAKNLEATPQKSEWPSFVGQPEGKLESEPLRVTLMPASKYVASHVSQEGVVIQNFPYSVGRLHEPNEPKPLIPINLALPDKTPYRLSRQHFSVSHDSNGYYVYDLGSTLGTEVNGEFLGQHFGKDHKSLEVGENTITAGGVNSPFIFKFRLEKD